MNATNTTLDPALKAAADAVMTAEAATRMPPDSPGTLRLAAAIENGALPDLTPDEKFAAIDEACKQPEPLPIAKYTIPPASDGCKRLIDALGVTPIDRTCAEHLYQLAFTCGMIEAMRVMRARLANKVRFCDEADPDDEG